MSQIYEHYLDTAYLNVVSGLMSPQEATKNAIEELARKGIQSITSDKGRTESASTVVKRAIRTGSDQTALKSQEENFFLMGGTLVEVSSHYGLDQNTPYGKDKFMNSPGAERQQTIPTSLNLQAMVVVRD